MFLIREMFLHSLKRLWSSLPFTLQKEPSENEMQNYIIRLGPCYLITYWSMNYEKMNINVVPFEEYGLFCVVMRA